MKNIKISRWYFFSFVKINDGTLIIHSFLGGQPARQLHVEDIGRRNGIRLGANGGRAEVKVEVDAGMSSLHFISADEENCALSNGIVVIMSFVPQIYSLDVLQSLFCGRPRTIPFVFAMCFAPPQF